MKVSALSPTGDWQFGGGFSNYNVGQAAIMQSIQTRLNMFLGDCFFAITQGIDWMNLLGSSNQSALNLAITSTIVNTDGVTSLQQLSVNLNRQTRALSISYLVTTIYTGITLPSAATPGTVNFLLTQGGDIITTQDGSPIVVT